MKIRAKNLTPRERGMLPSAVSVSKQADASPIAGLPLRDHSPQYDQKLEQGMDNFASLINERSRTTSSHGSMSQSSYYNAAAGYPEIDGLPSSFFSFDNPGESQGHSEMFGPRQYFRQSQQGMGENSSSQYLFEHGFSVGDVGSASSNFLFQHQPQHQMHSPAMMQSGVAERIFSPTAPVVGGDFNAAMLFPLSKPPSSHQTPNEISFFSGSYSSGIRDTLPENLLQQRSASRQRSDASAVSSGHGSVRSPFHERLSEDLEPRHLPPR